MMEKVVYVDCTFSCWPPTRPPYPGRCQWQAKTPLSASGSTLDGNYAYGDRAKVYAKSAQDAYLIVLRSDGAGRVRVLFPLEPQGNQRITAGKKYELKSRGGREAFVADDSSGHGIVLAAISGVTVSSRSIRSERALGYPSPVQPARA